MIQRHIGAKQGVRFALKVATAVTFGTLIAASASASLKLLTPACEEALALSALPAELRETASAYVLERRGYRLARQGRRIHLSRQPQPPR